MKVVNFPWDHWVDEENKEVWVHIPSGYPTVLGIPRAINRMFPGYKGSLCTANFLQSLKDNHEQKEST